MEASPHHLHLVNTHTGEATEYCEGCAELQQAIKNLVRSSEMKIRNLEMELAKERGTVTAVESEVIYRVLDLWATTMLDARWYSRLPKFHSGDERWAPVKKRLKQGYTEEYLSTVIEYVRFADTERVKRAWLEPKTLFGAHMESRYEDVIAAFKGPVWTPSVEWLRTELWKREQ